MMLETGASRLMQRAFRRLEEEKWEGPDVPENEEFEMLRAVAPVLKLVHVASRKLEAEKHPTLAFVYPTIISLQFSLARFLNSTNRHVQDVATSLSDSITARWATGFDKKAASLALALDPRFKSLSVLMPNFQTQTWADLEKAMEDEKVRMDLERDRELEEKGAGDDDDEEAEPEDATGVDDVDCFPTFAVAEDYMAAQLKKDSANVAAEIAEYKSMAGYDSGHPRFQPDTTADPLVFWRSIAKNKRLPILCRLARRFLAIPASSASVERLFSYTGERVSKKKTKLSDEMLLHLTMLKRLKNWVIRYAKRQ